MKSAALSKAAGGGVELDGYPLRSSASVSIRV